MNDTVILRIKDFWSLWFLLFSSQSTITSCKTKLPSRVYDFLFLKFFIMTQLQRFLRFLFFLRPFEFNFFIFFHNILIFNLPSRWFLQMPPWTAFCHKSLLPTYNACRASCLPITLFFLHFYGGASYCCFPRTPLLYSFLEYILLSIIS